MIEYALVGPADEIKTFARDIRPDVGTKPGWRWLPVERSEDQYDPVAAALESETTTIAKDRVVVNRAARAKTTEELEAEEAGRIDDALPPVLLSILTDLQNRLRALEGKPPLSTDEFRSAARQLID